MGKFLKRLVVVPLILFAGIILLFSSLYALSGLSDARVYNSMSDDLYSLPLDPRWIDALPKPKPKFYTRCIELESKCISISRKLKVPKDTAVIDELKTTMDANNCSGAYTYKVYDPTKNLGRISSLYCTLKDKYIVAHLEIESDDNYYLTIMLSEKAHE